ncbi:MAG: GtrA family protein [Burkholderiales bacterium]|nr:GtrA family protein [Burkholderiales bacterium]
MTAPSNPSDGSPSGPTDATSASARSTAARETAGQAGRYLIGAFLALALDATTVSLSMGWQAPVIVSRVAGLLVGVTTTYFFNRRFTFDARHPPSLRDWGQYVVAQSLGTAINFGVSTGLLFLLRGGAAVTLPLWQVWGAVLAGAAAGFCVNFFTARRLLHRRGEPGDERR